MVALLLTVALELQLQIRQVSCISVSCVTIVLISEVTQEELLHHLDLGLNQEPKAAK